MKYFKSIILVLICCCIVCGCGKKSVNDKYADADKIDVNNQDTDTDKKFSMGKDLIIKNDNGEYRIKFTSVKETDERNEFSDKRADRVVIIEYEYENISLNDDLYVSNLNFKLYDKDNNAMETYPAGDTKYPSNISTGRKTVASEAYALNNENNYIEIEYYDNIFNSKPNGTIVLEWK